MTGIESSSDLRFFHRSALELARHGWFVHPWYRADRDGACTCRQVDCSAPGKHPASRHGLHDASKDSEQIASWWANRDFNIGVHCGRSGLFVIDVDPRNGGEESLEQLRAVCGPALDAAPGVATGGGGFHFYFSAPAGRPKLPKLPGIDFLHGDKSVIVPPSRHRSGQRYEWLEGRSFLERDLFPMPAELSILAGTLGASRSAGSAVDQPGRGDSVRTDIGDRIPEGQRNNRLFEMARHQARTFTSEAEFVEWMQRVNREKAEPPLPDAEVTDLALRSYRHAWDAPQQGPLLLDVPELLQEPKPRWLVDDMIEESSLVLATGKPGSFKSFICLDLALHIAQGKPEWLGKSIGRHGPVVYLCGEGYWGFRDRVEGWIARHGEVGGMFTGRTMNLNDPSAFQALVGELEGRAIRPLLIVVDTLARAMAGSDENSAKDMGVFVKQCDRLREQTGAAVLLVHHPGKHQASGARGSSALDGAIDTHIGISSMVRAATLTCHKQKNAAEFSPVTVRLTRENDTLVVDFNDRLAPVVFRPRAEHLLLETLREFGEEGARSTQWARASDLPKSTFDRGRSRLVARGEVTKRGDYYFVSEDLEDFTIAS